MAKRGDVETITNNNVYQSGDTRIGFVGIHEFAGSVEAFKVVAEQESAATATFNVKLDGNNLFASNQSISASNTPTVHYPDQNKYAAASALPVDVNLSSWVGSNTPLRISLMLRRL